MSNAWITQRPIAHRGLWNESAPENSIAAYERAIADNYPIEIDVQMLADGEMVVFHDRSGKRMTGHNSVISEMCRDDIMKLCLCGTQHTIPFLRDVLKCVDGRVPILIEMKGHGCDKKLFMHNLKKVLREYRGVLALSSFDPFLAKRAKENFPDIICGQNFTDHRIHGVISGWVRKMGMYIAWISARHMPDFFVCRASLLPLCWILPIAQKYNRPILTWAIDSDETYERIAHTIDNEIFDHAPHINDSQKK
jgi:glycerophosphoryl diester phosphodiesterase